MKKKKILFGVAGEGMGHAARAGIVIKHLQEQGHHVKVISYHQGYWFLKDHFDVVKIFGLRFSHKNGVTTYPGTVLENIKKTPEATATFKRLKQLVKKFQPDIIFTDLEPFSSLLAHLYKIPLISIDNQHRITQGEVEYDKRWIVDYLLNKTGVATVAFGAQAYIITSFFDFKITHPNSYIVPPILRPEVLKAKPKNKSHILVYNTTSETEILIRLLQEQKNQKFIVYGQNKEESIANCILKKQSKDGFLNDLVSAKAVIATAGFTLISEALYLKKPYLALPVKRRVEQLINAYYLRKLGYGDYTEKITSSDLESFLGNLNKFRHNLQSYNHDNNSGLFILLNKLLAKHSL